MLFRPVSYALQTAHSTTHYTGSCSVFAEDVLTGQNHSSTRSLLRLLPVLSTCKSVHEKISSAIEDAITIFTQHNSMLSDTDTITYKTEAKVRNNTDGDLSSMKLIHLTGSVVQSKFPNWKVNLHSPAVHIFIDVLKTVAYISVVKDYAKYRKFNLQELAVGRAQAKNATRDASNNSRVTSTKTSVTDEVLSTANTTQSLQRPLK